MSEDIDFAMLGRYEYAKKCIAEYLAERRKLCEEIARLSAPPELWNPDVRVDAEKIKDCLEKIRVYEGNFEVAITNMNFAAESLGRKPYRATPV